MAGSSRRRVGLAGVGAAVACGLAVSAVAVMGTDGSDLGATGRPAPVTQPDTSASSTPVAPETAGAETPGTDSPETATPGTASSTTSAVQPFTVRSAAEPQEPVEPARPWTVPDPSVKTAPEEVVAEGAPDADDGTALRVVTVVNRDGEAEVLVQKVRGADAAVTAVGEAQETETALAVSVDTRITLDAPPARPAPAGGLVRTDTLRTNQWALDRLEAERVWADYSSGAGTVVAVVDTGVDGGHPDLAGRFTSAGFDYVAGSGDGRVDPHGHGTHVAGVVAAVRGNAIGVVGLAPLAQVMPLRVLDGTGAGWSSNIAKAIIYAADNGADVVNLSLGGPTEDSSTKVAVNYALSKSVIVVAAAGNNRATGNAANYPAAYPGVLAVASIERGDTSSTFSTTGPYVDIAAPGGRILSTVPGGYAYMSGTSMATPHVSAVGALVTNLTGGTVTTAQFESALTRTAWDLGVTGWDPEFGHGLVNVHRSLCQLSTCGASAPTPTPSPSPTPTATPTPGAPAPTPAPAPAPAPTATITPSASPSPTASPYPRSSASPEPSPTSEPAPERRRLRLTFSAGGGTASRGQRVPISLRATDLETGEAVPGQRTLVRGWRDGTIEIRRWVSTDRDGRATTRLRIRATTRFDLRAPATESTRAATSRTSILWRVR